MTQYRRLDRDEAYNFFRLCGCNYYMPKGSYILVEERDKTSGWLRHAFSGSFKTIVNRDIPDPVKELLCSAVREYILEEGRDREYLEPLCIRDKLKSRRAKGLTKGALFSAYLMHTRRGISSLYFHKDIEELVYDDSV